MTQKEALAILKMGNNVFLTGAAGSGKTFLINEYLKYLREHDVEVGVTASTGIAATHLGGVTIHSWSGMGVKDSLSEYDLEALEEKQYLYRRFERVKVLIVDEISMLHHFRLDLLDKILRFMKRVDAPFGGMQVILCGDFFQLPPVTRRGEPESYFSYHARSFKEGGFTVCYLTEQFRQKDDAHLKLLNEIRKGEVTATSKKLLKDRLNKKTLTELEPTRLYTHNSDVDDINFAELTKLPGNEVQYHMDDSGKDFIVEALKKSCLAPETLRLKVGARVMCVKNSPDLGYVNGTLGIVVSCARDRDPIIKLSSGREITLSRASWSIEEEGKVKAELTQYPLRLAWAITVHKSQGMSLDAVEVDLSKSFEKGMGYVALSRVRTLEGLTLLGINELALQVDEEVLLYDQVLQELGEEAREKVEEMGDAVVKKRQEEFLAYIRPKQKEKKVSTFEKTAELLEKKLSLEEMAKERGITKETILSHIEKLQEEGSKVSPAYLKKEITPAHFKKIQEVCDKVHEEKGRVLLSPVKEKVGASISYWEIRLVRLLLGYSDKE